MCCIQNHECDCQGTQLGFKDIKDLNWVDLKENNDNNPE